MKGRVVEGQSWARGGPLSFPVDGFSLAEVLVATAMAMLFLLPLASHTLSQYRRVDSLVTRPVPLENYTPWDWASASVWASLEERGVEVTSAAVSGAQTVVGLWGNGWLLDERPLTPGDTAMVGANRLPVDVAAELVVRVRTADGPWGPPIRLVSPAGNETGEAAANQGSILLHLPQCGEFRLATDWEGSSVTSADWRAETPPGTRQITLGAITQGWVSEPGRDLDVFF